MCTVNFKPADFFSRWGSKIPFWPILTHLECSNQIRMYDSPHLFLWNDMSLSFISLSHSPKFTGSQANDTRLMRGIYHLPFVWVYIGAINPRHLSYIFCIALIWQFWLLHSTALHSISVCLHQTSQYFTRFYKCFVHLNIESYL